MSNDDKGTAPPTTVWLEMARAAIREKRAGPKRLCVDGACVMCGHVDDGSIWLRFDASYPGSSWRHVDCPGELVRAVE